MNDLDRRNVVLTSAAAFALYLAVVLALLQASNWNPSSFVLAADNFTDRSVQFPQRSLFSQEPVTTDSSFSALPCIR